MRPLRHLCYMLIFLFVTSAYGKDIGKQYRDIQKEIKRQKKKIEEVKAQEKSVLVRIDEVNKKLDEIKKKLRKERIKINRTKEKITVVKEDIRTYKESLDTQRAYLKRKLSSMQRYGNKTTNTVFLMISSQNFSQFMRNIHYIKKIAEYDYRQIELYKETIEKLNRKKKRLSSLYVQLRAQEKELKNKEKALKAERQHKQVLLASVRKQKHGYRKMLKELTSASNKIRKLLEERAANTYRLTRFALLKGKLSWPVDGKVAIPYGSYKDPRFKTPVFRRGVYIESGEEDIAKAIYAGKVVYADWFKGYGKVIIVNHGSGYHSVYANLSEIFFKPGEIVKRRQAIGKVGNSGTIDAPALYFEIRYKGKPLNPLQWLAKRK